MRILGLLGLLATPVAADVTAAVLILPTDRYDHGVLGDAVEWGGLRISVTKGPDLVVTLPQTRVFEDVEARLADLDGDGRREVVVVETDMARGASLAVYDGAGKRAATAFIGQTHRWLAPAGIGDFDGDGRVELAYVDRPHLAKELVFVRYAQGRLTEIARAIGFTNHRIGQDRISGGAVRCDGRDVLLVADAGWTRRIALRLEAAEVVERGTAPLRDTRPWRAACP